MTRPSKTRRSGPKPGSSFITEAYVPEAGDLMKVDFSPTVGTEKSGFRRALVISPRAYNARVGRCFACPITSTVNGYPFEVALPAGLSVTGVVMSDEGKSIDWRARRVRFVATAPQDVLDEVRVLIGTFLVIP